MRATTTSIETSPAQRTAVEWGETRTPEQLEQHAAELVDLAMSMRRGDFTAMPNYRACSWCDFGRLCPCQDRAPEG